MRSRTWTTLLAVAMVGAVALTGCSSANNQAPAAEKKAAEKIPKPPLEVPKSFENDQAKRDFAVKALLDDYYAEAEPLLADVVKNAPTDAGAFAHLGTTRYMLKQYDQAIEAWKKAAELDPTVAAEMQNNIGNALRDARRTEEAVAAYRQALALDNSLATAAINLADVLKSEGKLDEAIAVLDSALEHNKTEKSLTTVAEVYKKEAATTKAN
ncbi:MAG TPA: tetratricopeptide repeat protein [Symbiobacteriaceae bacterium]|nr:tetratricopeptide repeat protein [Symbiobacteriaceae bacterium]